MLHCRMVSWLFVLCQAKCFSIQVALAWFWGNTSGHYWFGLQWLPTRRLVGIFMSGLMQGAQRNGFMYGMYAAFSLLLLPLFLGKGKMALWLSARKKSHFSRTACGNHQHSLSMTWSCWLLITTMKSRGVLLVISSWNFLLMLPVMEMKTMSPWCSIPMPSVPRKNQKNMMKNLKHKSSFLNQFWTTWMGLRRVNLREWASRWSPERSWRRFLTGRSYTKRNASERKQLSLAW